MIPKDRWRTTSAISVDETAQFLEALVLEDRYSVENYRFQIAPLGTKAQTIGIYKFWRKFPRLSTIVYANPVRYREELATFPPSKTWLIETTTDWEPVEHYGKL